MKPYPIAPKNSASPVQCAPIPPAADIALDGASYSMAALSTKRPIPQQSLSLAQALGLIDHTVKVNGVKLHYVTGGKGEPVLLIPGWPQSWYAWRYVMKQLIIAGRQVYALDPRGFGDSAKPSTGYDLATGAADIHAFIEEVGLSRTGGIDIVSHDVGSWIAFAHANTYRTDVRTLVLSEAAIPGTVSSVSLPSEEQNIKSWHFAFNRLDDLPETLVQGHEGAYLNWLFTNKATKSWMLEECAIHEYVRKFSSPGGARAGFEYYRQAFNEAGQRQMKIWTKNTLKMPVLTLSGEDSLGTNMLTSLRPYAANLTGIVIKGCGHFLPEECPDEYVEAAMDFWARPEFSESHFSSNNEPPRL